MLGFVLVLIGSLCLATQNVLLRAIFSKSSILGMVEWGGLLSPSAGHSLLILQMRSLLMLPFMLVIAPCLHSETWSEVQQLLTPRKRSLLRKILASGGFLFISMALLFSAIAQIPAGVATILFFTHPAITVLLSWKLFGDRPTALRIGVLVTMLIGIFFITPSLDGVGGNALIWGLSAAFGAGIGYSLQSLFAQASFSEIHPVSFTLATFVVVIILSSCSLLFVQIDVSPQLWTLLWILSAIAGLFTLIGQLTYNLGIRLTSASFVGIIGISNPTLTAALAWIVLQEALANQQILGMLMVVLGVIALSQERRSKTN
jgi:drug/metabolite transporter (DMT)-like permease